MVPGLTAEFSQPTMANITDCQACNESSRREVRPEQHPRTVQRLGSNCKKKLYEKKTAANIDAMDAAMITREWNAASRPGIAVGVNG